MCLWKDYDANRFYIKTWFGGCVSRVHCVELCFSESHCLVVSHQKRCAARFSLTHTHTHACAQNKHIGGHTPSHLPTNPSFLQGQCVSPSYLEAGTRGETSQWFTVREITISVRLSFSCRLILLIDSFSEWTLQWCGSHWANSLYVNLFLSGFLCVHYLLLLQRRGEWIVLLITQKHKRLFGLKLILATDKGYNYSSGTHNCGPGRGSKKVLQLLV